MAFYGAKKTVLNLNNSAQFGPQTLNLIKNAQRFVIYSFTNTEGHTHLYRANFVQG
jgi:hypothetical protein